MSPSPGGRRPASPLDLIIFDLDGTLIDSREDLAQSVNLMRRELGFPPLSLRTVLQYVGRGARNLVRRSLPASWSGEPDEALEIFLGHYRDHLLDNTAVYPGVRETLEALRDSGLRLAVLTNKPKAPTLAILAGLGLPSFFDVVLGGDSLPVRKPDPLTAEEVIKATGAAPSRTLLVGDSLVDLETARAAKLPFVGVTYGFAAAEELRGAGAEALVDRFADLLPFADGVRALPGVPGEKGE